MQYRTDDTPHLAWGFFFLFGFWFFFWLFSCFSFKQHASIAFDLCLIYLLMNLCFIHSILCGAVLVRILSRVKHNRKLLMHTRTSRTSHSADMHSYAVRETYVYTLFTYTYTQQAACVYVYRSVGRSLVGCILFYTNTSGSESETYSPTHIRTHTNRNSIVCRVDRCLCVSLFHPHVSQMGTHIYLARSLTCLPSICFTFLLFFVFNFIQRFFFFFFPLIC